MCAILVLEVDHICRTEVNVPVVVAVSSISTVLKGGMLAVGGGGSRSSSSRGHDCVWVTLWGLADGDGRQRSRSILASPH